MTQKNLEVIRFRFSFDREMKQLFTISLAFMLLVLSARDLVTFAAFKWHQNEIADGLCVNKYEPIPMCFGQCFLEEQIAENKNQDSDPAAGFQLELSEKPVYLLSDGSSIAFEDNSFVTSHSFTYEELHSLFLAEAVFQPPRLI